MQLYCLLGHGSLLATYMMHDVPTKLKSYSRVNLQKYYQILQLKRHHINFSNACFLTNVICPLQDN